MPQTIVLESSPAPAKPRRAYLGGAVGAQNMTAAERKKLRAQIAANVRWSQAADRSAAIAPARRRTGGPFLRFPGLTAAKATQYARMAG